MATSLSEGEAKTKKVGLLHIRGDKLRMEQLTLKSVRPFVFRSIHLGDATVDLTTPCTNLSSKVCPFGKCFIYLLIYSKPSL